MIPTQLSFGPYKTDMVELRGGVNENVSSIELKAGELIECRNYMIAEGGYGGYISTKGYEVVDGKIIPSEVVSYITTMLSLEQEVAVGDTLVCTETTESFLVVGVHLDDLVLELTTATVAVTTEPADNLTLGGTALGQIVSFRPQVGATFKYHAATDAAYASVLAVPGEGYVLGVHVFNSTIYAFRKKVGAATVGIYKESATTGWTEVTQVSPLTYSEGNHKFEFTNYNFYSTSSTSYFYFCDGVNKARECTGSQANVVDNAGMDPNDKPTHILALNDRLWLSYAGGSLQGSTMGLPLDWTTAPVEFGIGKDVSNLSVGLNSTLLIFSEPEGIKILNGTTEENFELTTFSDEAGAVRGTVKGLLGTTFFVSDQGITTMEGVTEFGDYATNSISQRFKRTLLQSKPNITGAVTSKQLNQYRLFFQDGKAIYIGFEGKEMQGATLVQFLDRVLNLAQGQHPDGSDLIVFTSDDGFIYRMDSGRSFNGLDIVTRMVTAYYHYGSLRNFKSFKRATFEIFGENDQEIYMKCQFDYREPTQPTTDFYTQRVFKAVGGAVWGEGVWGDMIWGTSSVTSQVATHINGVGTNMSYLLLSRERYREQHIIQNIVTDYQLCARRT